MQTLSFLYMLGKNMEINRCLNYFLNIGKLYSFIVQDTSEEKIMSWIPNIILSPEQLTFVVILSVQFRCQDLKIKRKLKILHTFPLLHSLKLNSDAKSSFAAGCASSV